MRWKDKYVMVKEITQNKLGYQKTELLPLDRKEYLEIDCHQM